MTVEGAPEALRGRAVTLEALQEHHVDGLFAAAMTERATYGYTYVPDSRATTEAYVREALAERDAGRAVPFATVDTASGGVIGTTRFANFHYFPWPEGHTMQRGAALPDDVEIGWTWLAADAQRTAANTEAKYLMLGHAFENWQVHVVRLKTDARNERSRRAIERIGGRFEGVMRAHMPASDGGMRDTAWFSIVADEWPAVKAGLEGLLGGARAATEG